MTGAEALPGLAALDRCPDCHRSLFGVRLASRMGRSGLFLKCVCGTVFRFGLRRLLGDRFVWMSWVVWIGLLVLALPALRVDAFLAVWLVVVWTSFAFVPMVSVLRSKALARVPPRETR